MTVEDMLVQALRAIADDLGVELPDDNDMVKDAYADALKVLADVAMPPSLQRIRLEPGDHPIISVPGCLDEKVYARIKECWNAAVGKGKFPPIILEGGMRLEAVLNDEDGEVAGDGATGD